MDINCFISNSLNSRICNSFINSETFKGSFLNRGASGIDGNIASAIGCAKGNKKDVLAIVGDLTLLYDMNALALAKQVEHNIKICVINNQGGAIFNALKHVKDPRVLDKYFKTTHTFSFSGLAKQFDFEYFCIDERETMEDRLTGFVNNQIHSLCEVKINEAETFAHIKELTINFL